MLLKRNHKHNVGISVDIFQSNSDPSSTLTGWKITVVIVGRFTASRLFDTPFWSRTQRYRQATEYGIKNCTDRQIFVEYFFFISSKSNVYLFYLTILKCVIGDEILDFIT